MVGQTRITRVVALVLRAFLDDVDAPRYGLELMKVTGLPSGTLYPTIARLERDGWLISEMEDIDPKIEKRPPRRYFKLNPAMAERARYEVAALVAQLALPGHAITPSIRPGLAGGMV